MNNREQKRAALLGMPHGTAMNRLRKRVMFSLVQELHHDICHVCEDLITDSEDLSMEHIKPWEGRDAALFWDITNIAFSHRWCNRPHVLNNGGGKAQQPGYAWCAECEEELPHGCFSFKTAKSGNKIPRAYCKPCRVERKSLGLPA